MTGRLVQRAGMLLLGFICITACSGGKDRPNQSRDWSNGLVIYFDCADVLLPVTFQRDFVKVALENESIVLPQVASESGGKFVRDGDSFWEQGLTASAQLAGTAFNCQRLQPVLFDRVVFTAHGAEPSWRADVFAGGGVRFYAEASDVSMDPYLLVGTSDSNPINESVRVIAFSSDSRAGKLQIFPEDCQNGLSDQEYSMTALLSVANSNFRGCAEVIEQE